MHETLEAFLAEVIYYSLMFKLAVKMSITFLFFLGLLKKGSRQYAWDLTLKMFSTHQRLNVEYPNNKIYDHSRSINKSKYSENGDIFNQWLVGVTDGDGSFTLSRLSEGRWTLFFKITQSTYNLRMLYFIKKQLGVGSVNITANNQKADFRIRDRKTIGSIIIPIFEKYPLLTSKYHSYEKFKKAYYILEDTNLSTKEKDNLLLELQSEEMPNNYISIPRRPSTCREKNVNYTINEASAHRVRKLGVMSELPNSSLSPQISHLNINSRLEDIKSAISIYWLVGFVESVGYFVIRNESKPIIEFTIKTEPADPLILHFIKRLLQIPNKVMYVEEEQRNILTTTNNRAVKNVIEKFSKIQSRKLELGKFRGVKSLMFKLWTKAHYYKDKDPKKFAKLAGIMLKIVTLNEKGLMSKGGGHNSVVDPLYFGQESHVSSPFRGETKLHVQTQSSSLKKNLSSSLSNKRVDFFQRRSVSSLSTASSRPAYSKLDSWFVTGFADGESYFSISIVKSPRLNKMGTQVKVRFILTQHSRDLDLMKTVVEFLGCGNLSEVTNTCVYLTVSKLIEINDKVIPLLNKYPLQGSKKLDFDLFCEVVELMKTQAHLTTDGLEKIRALKARMNTGRSVEE